MTVIERVYDLFDMLHDRLLCRVIEGLDRVDVDLFAQALDRAAQQQQQHLLQ